MSPKAETRRSARVRSEYQACLAVLKQARIEAGLSQAQLAKRLEKPQSWIDKCEAGHRRVDFVELIRIAEALGVSPATLLWRCKEILPQ